MTGGELASTRAGSCSVFSSRSGAQHLPQPPAGVAAKGRFDEFAMP
jgi:hypothetical protein